MLKIKYIEWSDKHPNDRLKGMCLRQPDKENELKEIFKTFLQYFMI